MKDPQLIRERLRGPINTLPTIFTKEGEIDHEGMRNVIDRSIEGGTEVTMLTGGSSMLTLLSDAEIAQIHRTLIDHVGGRTLTVACGHPRGLNHVREFACYVRELGFDLCMATPADWARGTPETLAEFYRALADEMRLMLVGNVPIRTCELIEDHPNILAFKDDYALDYAHEVLLRWGDRWAMMGGGGMKRHHLLWPHGNCRGWLDIFIQWCPRPPQAYWEALQRGDTAAAWSVVMDYEVPVWDFTRRIGLQGMKHAFLEVYGIAPRWLRSPAPYATDEQLEQVREFVRDLGLL